MHFHKAIKYSERESHLTNTNGHVKKMPGGKSRGRRVKECLTHKCREWGGCWNCSFWIRAIEIKWSSVPYKFLWECRGVIFKMHLIHVQNSRALNDTFHALLKAHQALHKKGDYLIPWTLDIYSLTVISQFKSHLTISFSHLSFNFIFSLSHKKFSHDITENYNSTFSL